MIKLLENDLPAHYKIGRKIRIKSEETNQNHFDLADAEKDFIVPYKNGDASFENSGQTSTKVINYEKYLNCFHGTRFENGRKRCDFILYGQGDINSNFFLLNELTSTLGSTKNLSKPILDKDKNVTYPGGKYEKAEAQLGGTLETLINVPSISSFINKFKRKVCLMSYVITPVNEVMPNARRAFSERYKKVEARETGENGALLKAPLLNAQGFEYRRISHDYSFKLN